MEKLGDYSQSFEEILTASIQLESRSFDTEHQPDIKGIKTWVLRDSPRSKKIAKYWTIRNRHTNEVHHNQLTLETIKRVKKYDAWLLDSKHTITLSDEDTDEIGALLNALSSVPAVGGDGKFLVLNLEVEDDDRLKKIFAAISASGRKLELFQEILSWSELDSDVVEGLIEIASDVPSRSKSLAAALNYARYSRTLDEFSQLVEQDAKEAAYQKFLQRNTWIFGSEYSELIDIRNLAPGIELDFPLRRTVDGYVEAIEIKRPLYDKPIFIEDKSHKNWYESNELKQAIAQARKYVATLDAAQYQIKALHDLRVDKVRVKVVIGRDGTIEQQNALRMLNSHDMRIEVITYDQLLRTGKRILEILAEEAELRRESDTESGSEGPPRREMSDIPF